MRLSTPQSGEIDGSGSGSYTSSTAPDNACDEATYKAAVFQEHWQCHGGAQFMRNETKACFLDKTEPAYISSAEPSGAIEDSFEDRVQVVWRTGNGAQHFRDSHPLCRQFSYLLL